MKALLVVVCVLSVMAMVWAQSVQANTGSLGFSLVATHPEAAAQSTSQGKTIHELRVHNGSLISGYGDYNANTGPIHINPFDLTSNSFSGSVLSVPTEQIDTLRVLGGKVYAPAIDPSCGAICTDVYAGGEPWEVGQGPAAAHIYDMATFDGSDIWIVGSANLPSSGAHIWRSVDGGETWTVAQSDTRIPAGGFDRYYWIASLNGKIYAQASLPNAPVRIFDGTSWTTGTTEIVAPSSNTGTKVEVFAGNIITRKNGLSAFSGTTIQAIAGFTGGVKDTYAADDGYLYIVRNNNTLVRTPDLQTWQELGTVPSVVTSVAVHNGYVYIGGTDSGIYRSAQQVPAPPSVTLTLPSEGATISKVASFAATTTGSSMQSVSFRLANLDLGTVNAAPYSVSWDTAQVPNGAYVVRATSSDGLGSVATDEISVVINNSPTESPAPTPNEESEIPNTSNMRAFSDAVNGYGAFLHTPDGTEITCSHSFAEETAAVKDVSHSYTNGLTEFCFNTSQHENQVKLTFVTDLQPEQVVARKYNYIQSRYFDISEAEITKTTYQNKPALQVAYTIVDNGELDLDPEVGKIKDPIGLALAEDGSTSGALASTGTGQRLLFVMLFTTVLATCAFMQHQIRDNYITKNT